MKDKYDKRDVLIPTKTERDVGEKLADITTLRRQCAEWMVKKLEGGEIKRL